MPIYEYQCNDCEHAFETIQKISEDPLTQCPNCSKDTLRKKVSAAGFRLKGGGWYETDFKGDKRKNVSGSDSTDSSSKDGSNSTKSDSGGGGGDNAGSSAAGKSDSGSASGSNSSSTPSTGSGSSKGGDKPSS